MIPGRAGGGRSALLWGALWLTACGGGPRAWAEELEPLGPPPSLVAEPWTFDTGALAILDGERRASALAYWSALVDSARRLSAGAELRPWTRPTYVVRNHGAYRAGGSSPEGDHYDAERAREFRRQLEQQLADPAAAARLTTDAYPGAPPDLVVGEPEPVPIQLLPTPAAVRARAEAAGLLRGNRLRAGRGSDVPFAHQLGFAAAQDALFEATPYAIPQPLRGERRATGNPKLSTHLDPLEAGLAVVQDRGLEFFRGRLAARGIEALEITCVELAAGVWLAELRSPGAEPEVQVGFPLADAHGAARLDRPRLDPERGTWYENPLRIDGLDPRFGRHSLLVWPRPMPAEAEGAARNWRSGRDSAERRAFLESRFLCATEAWGSAGPPLWLLFEEQESRPLQPALRLTRDLAHPGSPVGVAAGVDLAPDLALELLLRAVGLVPTDGEALRTAAQEFAPLHAALAQ